MSVDCSQCGFDEVDTKLEDLFNRVNDGRSDIKILEAIMDIRDEIHPLVSCH